MAYTPTTWVTGDVITATKLNNMEQGIANAGGAVIVGYTFEDGTITLDKTWQEINDGMAAGNTYVIAFDPEDFADWSWEVRAGVIVGAFSYGDYSVRIGDYTFTAASPTGYPQYHFGD